MFSNLKGKTKQNKTFFSIKMPEKKEKKKRGAV